MVTLRYLKVDTCFRGASLKHALMVGGFLFLKITKTFVVFVFSFRCLDATQFEMSVTSDCTELSSSLENTVLIKISTNNLITSKFVIDNLARGSKTRPNSRGPKIELMEFLLKPQQVEK